MSNPTLLDKIRDLVNSLPADAFNEGSTVTKATADTLRQISDLLAAQQSASITDDEIIVIGDKDLLIVEDYDNDPIGEMETPRGGGTGLGGAEGTGPSFGTHGSGKGDKGGSRGGSGWGGA